MEAVADLFGMFSGTIVKYTHRVIRGLRCVAFLVIRWPKAHQRAEQAMWVGDSFGFDECIGATDEKRFLWHTSLLCTHERITTAKASRS